MTPLVRVRHKNLVLSDVNPNLRARALKAASETSAARYRTGTGSGTSKPTRPNKGLPEVRAFASDSASHDFPSLGSPHMRQMPSGRKFSMYILTPPSTNSSMPLNCGHQLLFDQTRTMSSASFGFGTC